MAKIFDHKAPREDGRAITEKSDPRRYLPFGSEEEYMTALLMFIRNHERIGMFNPRNNREEERRKYIESGGTFNILRAELALEFRIINGMSLDSAYLSRLRAMGVPNVPETPKPFTMLQKKEDEKPNIINEKPYVSPSRVGKKAITIHVDPAILSSFNQIKADTGLGTDYLGHMAIALLLEKFDKDVPDIVDQRLSETGPKRPGPPVGTKYKPRNRHNRE